MQKSKYRCEIILYWSDEDEAYMAGVPELPGCAADGPTYQEAIANSPIPWGWQAASTSTGTPRRSH